MSSEYYSLEKAAEVLGLPTAEINRLREKSVLRAFRDGSSWKFRKVDVDNYLAETIKNRNKKDDVPAAAGDSDFDLLSMDDETEEMPTLLADSASFDSLMEDGLALDNEMIDAAPSPEKSAPEEKVSFDSDDLVLEDDGLSLSGDDGLSLMEGGPDDELILTDSSSASGTGTSEIDLAVDDDLVLDGGSSGHLDLAGDSGLSLLDVADDVDFQSVDKGGSDIMLELADDDDILSLVDDDLVAENTSTIAIPVEDDFQLTPDMGPMVADDSESASQVIALEEDNMFGTPIESSAVGAGMGASPFGNMDQPAMDTGGMPFIAPSGPGEFVSTAPAHVAPTSSEAQYSPILVTALVFAAILLAVPGIMFLDLIIHIWSWDEPFVINSTLMDLFSGIAGLK